MARFYNKDGFKSVLGQPELGMRDLSPDSGQDIWITRHIVIRLGRKEELRDLPEKPLLPPTPKKPVKSSLTVSGNSSISHSSTILIGR